MNRFTRLLATLAACSLPFAAQAASRPLVIQETQWLGAPDASLSNFGESVAVDGDWALATALRSADGSFEYPYEQRALLYRRVNGTWRFERTLVADPTDEESWNDPHVAMENGLAAVSTSPLRAFRRVGTQWTETPPPFPAAPGTAGWANGMARIDGGTLAAITNRCQFGAGTAILSGTGWSAPRIVTGNDRYCDVANYSGAIDLSGNRLVMTNPQESTDHPPNELRIYERTSTGGAWRLSQSLPTGDWGRGVALLGDDLIVGDWDPRGNLLYRRGADGWRAAGHLPTLKGFSQYYDGAWRIAREGDLVAFAAPLFDDLRGSIAVYRRHTDGSYDHVALLVARNGDDLGPVVDISGRTVVVGARNAAGIGRLYFFELPASFAVPAVVQHDFENGGFGGWSAVEGRFQVVQRGVTRVARQTGLTGPGRLVLTDSNFTAQSVTVDIRPREFAGDDRWAGVATRYRDADNHYFVSLRSSGSVQLRRVRDGVVTVLASRPFPVKANGSYRVRLESIGSRHRVFVNGEQQLAAIDAVFGRGRVALLTDRVAADFDNVVVTPGVRQTIFDTAIVNGAECERFVEAAHLRVSGSPQWDCSVYERGYLRQASNSGATRAAIGPVTDDQVVESRVLVESFAAARRDAWVGVTTRFTDDANHYFLALSGSNEVALNKMVNGRVVELDRVALTLAPTAWYRLRLEAVGDQLRGYVNNILYVQATDGEHPSGISGITTERTAARFDYFRVHQP